MIQGRYTFVGPAIIIIVFLIGIVFRDELSLAISWPLVLSYMAIGILMEIGWNKEMRIVSPSTVADYVLSALTWPLLYWDDDLRESVYMGWAKDE